MPSSLRWSKTNAFYGKYGNLLRSPARHSWSTDGDMKLWRTPWVDVTWLTRVETPEALWTCRDGKDTQGEATSYNEHEVEVKDININILWEINFNIRKCSPYVTDCTSCVWIDIYVKLMGYLILESFISSTLVMNLHLNVHTR